MTPYPDVFQWQPLWSDGANDYEHVRAKVESMALLHHDVRNWYPWFDRLNTLSEILGVTEKRYVHLDLYLWIVAYGKQLEQLKNNYHKLAEWQEDLFLRLLAELQPKTLICL